MSHPTAFLVPMARWNHTDSIPNSGVKRYYGDDTWRLAVWENSERAKINYQFRCPLQFLLKGAFGIWEISTSGVFEASKHQVSAHSPVVGLNPC